MESVTVPVSIGELLDKITILEIKSQRINDRDKRQNVEKELAALTATVEQYTSDAAVRALTSALTRVNERLWDVEDNLREHEREQHFDDEFIQLARSVYHLNDERAALKRKLNSLLGSSLIEEKSYSSYASAAVNS